jgi:hypothetical protein
MEVENAKCFTPLKEEKGKKRKKRRVVARDDIHVGVRFYSARNKTAPWGGT